jgi:catechol 2,3-dioxygenase-like lactoylglutathione lyase family enzyme
LSAPNGINGIETIIYGVEDMETCTRYFTDFGLPLIEASDAGTLFELKQGCSVILRPLADAVTEGQRLKGIGVQKVIWGVPDQKHFDRAVKRLRTGTEVSIDDSGTAHFLDCDRIAMGLRIWNRVTVMGAPEPVNSYDNVQRLNSQRKWLLKAAPKTIEHVVYQVPDPDASWAWYQKYLDFRLSDVQTGFGIFARAPGCTEHHSIYWIKASLPFPGFDNEVRFNHVNYGVEDFEEAMVGANYMERRGWPKSVWGLGRHRIASAIFLYLPCPAGGDAEYGADSDHLDDSWVPRVWNAGFGTMTFMHNLQPWIFDEAPWQVAYVEGATPTPKPQDH